ncbi:MAG: 2-oxoacid:acceptor oxidoreductase family protein [Planctomycetota bacterium]|jgi:indolepyruvate ferredoxin oxidoreductase beta subunit|nr:pyruvate ferredoxin oxidoreductase [Planctomycetota bacterium]MDP6368342.1 2-oxoacid:acceptor oxidoreductase family protein [Planctomycetota bacterium]MDP6519616.1 2-oxoacid:acceptor oxidoreductase family protein [Planctomycetota bacterium]MDP6837801.1 2-oxoacid:acceptor oxidoreductase family protein [Planctomycetota bacterium]MDP6954647.1 2-oxoacid:acceptor oxidoreductase family protein [Planctomycetota bacterium]
METTRLLIVGVGGQGVLSAARNIGQAALNSGLDVRIGQIHGLSQRGGSVESTVVIGPGSTGFVSRRQADVLLALEPLEALRALSRIHENTLALVNRAPVTPFSQTLAGDSYPSVDQLLGPLAAAAGEVYGLDATALASESGSPRSLNAAMLGTLVGLDALPLPADQMRSVLAAAGRPVFRPLNLAAFDAGRTAASQLEAISGAAQNR